jgi:hypothetical protein
MLTTAQILAIASHNQPWNDDNPAVVHLEEFDIDWHDEHNDDWVAPRRSTIRAIDYDLEGVSFQEVLDEWIARGRVPCHLCREIFTDHFFLDIHLKRDHKVDLP